MLLIGKKIKYEQFIIVGDTNKRFQKSITSQQSINNNVLHLPNTQCRSHINNN